jgi:glucose/arabinose dehydrogenase
MHERRRRRPRRRSSRAPPVLPSAARRLVARRPPDILAGMRCRSLVPVALLVAAALAACGSDDERSDGATDPTAVAPAQTDVAGAAAPAPGRGVRLVKVGDFDQPLYVASPPGDRRRLLVVEQAGRIRLLRGGRDAGTFLDLRSLVTSGGEQGLLGLAFAPDYATSGLFYVYFTGKDTKEHLVEYHRRTEDVADAGSARTVFVHDDPETNHNGGQLVFGPDGLLYVGTGDGGGGNDQHGTRGNAQNLASPLGKILRIDPRATPDGAPFGVPPSNPFVQRAGARPEIYAYGLRNPWRFSFDRARGDLVIGDVGQDATEEIDFARKGKARGANFGWRPFEGTTRLFDEPAPGAVEPVLTKAHSDGWCSITGGYVVRDAAVPGLAGRYVYGDYCKGQLRSARLAGGRATDDRPIAGLPTIVGLDSFGEDATGRVYVVSQSGPVYRFAAAR